MSTTRFDFLPPENPAELFPDGELGGDSHIGDGEGGPRDNL
jgi:hypothetical protein